MVHTPMLDSDFCKEKGTGCQQRIGPLKCETSELRFSYILARMLSGISVSTLLMVFCLTLKQSVKLSNVNVVNVTFKKKHIHLSGCYIKDTNHHKCVYSVSYPEIAEADSNWQIDCDY